MIIAGLKVLFRTTPTKADVSIIRSATLYWATSLSPIICPNMIWSTRAWSIKTIPDNSNGHPSERSSFARASFTLSCTSCGPCLPSTILSKSVVISASPSVAQAKAVNGALLIMRRALMVVKMIKLLFCAHTEYFERTCDSNQ